MLHSPINLVKLESGKILRFFFFSLILINVLSFNRTEAFDYKSFYMQTVSVLLFFFWACGVIKGIFPLFKDRLSKAVLLFFLLNLIYFIASTYKIASGAQFFNIFIYTVLYFAFLNAFTDINYINKFLNILAVSTFLCSSYGIAQRFGLDLLNLSNQAIFSTFVNPNFFAGFLAVNMSLCLGMLFLVCGTPKKIIYFFIFIAVAYSLILTQSKGGIIAGFSGVFIFLFLNVCFFLQSQFRNDSCKKRLIFAFITLTFVFITAITITILFWDSYERIISASLNERQLIWHLSANMIKDNPIWGRGLGTFVLFAPLYKQGLFHPEQFIRHAWNEFLELWTELGIFGLALFLAILFFINWMALKFIFVNKTDRNARIICIGALSSLWAGIVLNLGEINLRIIYLGIYFWLVVAILNRVINPNLKHSASVFKFISLIKPISFAAIIFISFILFKYSFTPFIMHKTICNNKSPSFLESRFDAETFLKDKSENLDDSLSLANGQFILANISAKEGDWNKAIEYLEKALQLNPQFLAAYNNLGTSYLFIGEIDKAVSYYEKALALDSKYLTANYNLGYAYFLKGKIKEAYERFAFCLKINPKDRNSFYMIKKRILY